jgi:hypothetical protein
VDFATTICRNAAVNRLHELTLAWQQLHLRAGENSLGNWQTFKERNDPIDPIALTAPSRLSDPRRLEPLLCAGASQAHANSPKFQISIRS